MHWPRKTKKSQASRRKFPLPTGCARVSQWDAMLSVSVITGDDPTIAINESIAWTTDCLSRWSSKQEMSNRITKWLCSE